MVTVLEKDVVTGGGALTWITKTTCPPTGKLVIVPEKLASLMV